MLTRRSLISSSVSVMALCAAPVSFADSAADSGIMKDIRDNITQLAESGGQVEVKDLLAGGYQVAGLQNRVRSKRRITDEGVQLIMAAEVSSKSTYQKKYTGIIWPRGKSGATIGIGYDIGYVSTSNLVEDWGMLGPDVLGLLTPFCGLTGKKAADAVSAFNTMNPGAVKIDFDTAMTVLTETSLPMYTDQLEHSLKNTDKLTDRQLGALVSLVYNRGFSFRAKSKDGRYDEMHAIRTAMASEKFCDVPVQLRKMMRLWTSSDNRGVAIRREIEAKIFELDLQKC